MGKRKSKRKPPTKRKAIEPLDTQFNCPFCNHEKSCEVKMYVNTYNSQEFICCNLKHMPTVVCFFNFQSSIKFILLLLTGIRHGTLEE